MMPKHTFDSKKKTNNDNDLPLIFSKANILIRNNKIKDITKKKALTLPQLSNQSHSSHSNRTYKYKLYPGNNSRVILNCLRRRPWWHPTINHNVAKSDNDIIDDESINPPNFIWQMHRNNKNYQNRVYSHTLLNHIQNNQCLVSKKGLYFSLKEYCNSNNIEINTIIPLTFYLSTNATNNRLDDTENFKVYNQKLRQTNSQPANELSCEPSNDLTSESSDDIAENTIWILKPASNTNRGFGIKVVKGITEVFNVINNHKIASSNKSKRSNKASNKSNDSANNGTTSTNTNATSNSSKENLSRAASRMANQNGYIVQLYLTNPLLISGRKFDIRCFVLVTIFNKKYSAYFFSDIYIRTSSKKFNLNLLTDKETHLTNDAIQKHSKSYGKYENGNKLTIEEFDEHIKNNYPNQYNETLTNDIVNKIKNHCKVSLLACMNKFNNTTITNSFELFGYDYMIDQDFLPYLIEVNTNPCLEFACPLLTTIISSVIEHTMRAAVDSVCPPPINEYRTKACQEAIELINTEPIKFTSLFD